MIRSRPDRWFDRFRRTGDARLLARVFDAVAPELWRVAAFLCHDRHLAEDAVQATFLSAIETPDDWDATRPLVPWLLGMLANRVREQRRQAARRPDVARLERAVERAVERDPADVAADREVSSTLQHALAKLVEPYRSTLERHLMHGLAAHEIARELAVPAGTVRMRLHRGLDQLRSKLPPGLVAAGGVALTLQTGALAAMRARVLGAVPGGAAVAAGSGHFVSFVIGVLAMNKMMCAVMGSILGVLLAWSAWPAAATTGDVAVTSGSAAKAALADSDEAAAAASNVVTPDVDLVERRAVATPTVATERGRLRVRLQRKGDGAPIDGAPMRVHGGLSRDPGTAPGSSAVASTAANEWMSFSNTDADGVAEFDLPFGFAAVTLEELDLRGSAEIRGGGVVELLLEVPVLFTAELRVVDDAGRPVPDARLVGSTSRDPFGLAAREFGRTDRDGRCSIDSVDRTIRLRARHDGHAASGAIELSHWFSVTLQLGSGPAVLSGTVLDATQRPLANCAVGLHPLTRSESGDAAPILVWTDAGGRFTCADVPAGRCLVVAVRGLDDGQSRLAQQEAIAVAGTETLVEVRFGSGATLDVQISAADGSSMAGTNVMLTLWHSEFDDEFARLGSVRLTLDAHGAGTAREGAGQVAETAFGCVVAGRSGARDLFVH